MNPNRLLLSLLSVAVAASVTIASAASLDHFFEDQSYDKTIPTVQDVTGITIGERALKHAQVEMCLQAWKDASNKLVLRTQGHSHEGRSLNHLIISAPANLEKIDEIQREMSQFGLESFSSNSSIVKSYKDLPAVSLFSYSIHGDECSATDAALMFVYHLIASNSKETKALLKNNIIIVNPLQNPDGRDRYLTMIAEARGANANADDQDLIPRGYWSRGRTNHYLFDLNRDWLFGIHPETQSLMSVIKQWNPTMVVDGHEMYPQETYLFSPPVAPINPNRPKWLMQAGNLLAKEQSKAFDDQNWLYYTGEWDEEWYPGYTTSWTAMRGSLPVLYEQARVTEGKIAHANGSFTTYRESVEHQFWSSITNLKTFSAHQEQLKEHYIAHKLDSVSADSELANRAYIFPPTQNLARMQRLLDTMKAQGIIVYSNPTEFELKQASDRLGNDLETVKIPAESFIIPCRQPLGSLVAALLQFDPQFPEGPARKERERLLREGKSNIYDITAWSLPMSYDLEAYECMNFPPIEGLKPAPSNLISHQNELNKEAYAYIIDGADDNSVILAGHLMVAGVQVRIADKPSTFDGNDYPRGTVVVTARDNREVENFSSIVIEKANALGIAVNAVGSGKATTESTDLGGGNYTLLQKPKVAILTRGKTSLYSVGSTWYLVDKTLDIPHSLINEENLVAGWPIDLRRYNVLIIPDRKGAFPPHILGAIKDWVAQGGTLIAMGSSVNSFIEESADFAGTQRFTDALEDLDAYEMDIHRSFMAETHVFPDYQSLLSHTVSTAVTYPAPLTGKTQRPGKKVLEMKAKWQNLFAPSGAILAARTNPHHWLNYGLGEYVPVRAARDPLLISKLPVESPVRLGYFTVSEAKETEEEENGDKKAKATRQIGWSSLPEGYEMNLRMSGLLWPEAADMLANASYLTCESHGDGQVILFANNPNFRNSTLGTARMLMNAIIYGPGEGTSPIIEVL